MDADGPTSTLTVTGPDLDERIPLSGVEVVIGRSEQCDVVLPGRQVSRLHARLFQDPLGRWVVEDLNSKRGVSVGGQPIVARVVAPGEPITVGPYAMAMEPPPVLAGPAVRGTPMPVLEDPGTKVHSESGRTSTTISEGRLHQLNVVSDRLAAVERAVDLYPEVCRALSTKPGMVVLVLRLPDGAGGSRGTTESLACHVGGAAAPASPDASGLRLSRRVLEAVRSRKRPVIASNTALGGRSSMELTLVDEACPRTVVCAPLTTGPDAEEVLYVDLPAARAGDDVLDFIQAVVRQVRFVQKSLVMAEEREKRRLLDHEIERAADIQAGLTPTGEVGVAGVDVAVHYQPAMWVGGDYCDIWPLPGDALAFAVGDVSGHGFAAAMVMTNLHAALRSAMGSSAGPAAAIQQVAAYLMEHMTGGMFVTLVLGVFDPASGRLEYVNAGHPLPLLVEANRAVSPLGEPENPPLGIVESTFRSRSVDLPPGGTLVIVTDGITETRSPSGELFGDDRLRAALGDQAGRPSQDVVTSLVDAATAFRHSQTQRDDITALSLRYCPA